MALNSRDLVQEAAKIDKQVKTLEKEVSILKVLRAETLEIASCITRTDVTEVKSFSNPPEIIQNVVRAASLALGEKGDWPSAKNVIFILTSDNSRYGFLFKTKLLRSEKNFRR